MRQSKTRGWDAYYKSDGGNVETAIRGHEEGVYTYLKGRNRFVRTEDLFDTQQEAEAAQRARFRDESEWMVN